MESRILVYLQEQGIFWGNMFGSLFGISYQRLPSFTDDYRQPRK